MRNLKFTKEKGEAFTKELKAEVNEYFKTRNASRFGDSRMIIKSTFILLLFLIPITLLAVGAIESVALLFVMYILSGLGMAGIGMNIMHDALHGTYSDNRRLTKIMGYSINIIGASAEIWKVQHNVLHHTYTNVTDVDDDLNASALLRFSPDKPKLKVHRFQYLYVWFFYGLMSLVWVTVRDYLRIGRYKKLGFFSKGNEFKNEIIKASGWKALYFIYGLALPMIMVPQPWWMVFLAFLSMHFVTGFILSVVFQTAHVMPSSEFPQPDDEGMIGGNWSVHQLATTCNYAPKSRIFSWLIGGLNYQIEHHLMPNVCHVHYRKLSPLVRRLAEKHGMPYYTKRTFLHALYAHMQMLKTLGA